MIENPPGVLIHAVAGGALNNAPKCIYAPFRGGAAPGDLQRAADLWIADGAFSDSLGLTFRRSTLAERWPDLESIRVSWNSGPQPGGPLYMRLTLFAQTPYVRDYVQPTWSGFYDSRRAAATAVQQAWDSNRHFQLLGRGQGTITAAEFERVNPLGKVCVAMQYCAATSTGRAQRLYWCWVNVQTGKVQFA